MCAIVFAAPSAFQEGRDLVGGITPHSLGDVGVDVKGDGDGAVPKLLLDDLGVNTGSELVGDGREERGRVLR
jgi:hypothetical protein